jgi:hypothetical protein
MASTPTLSLDDVRAERRTALSLQAARKAKYEKDRAALDAEFEADAQGFAAYLADLDAVERVLLRRQQQPRAASNGHDEQPEPDAEEGAVSDDDNDQTEGDGENMTQTDMVLAAVQGLHENKQPSMRVHIDEYIKREFGVAVPLSNISTYLRRLKTLDNLVENPGDGLSWYPTGGATP